MIVRFSFTFCVPFTIECFFFFSRAFSVCLFNLISTSLQVYRLRRSGRARKCYSGKLRIATRTEARIYCFIRYVAALWNVAAFSQCIRCGASPNSTNKFPCWMATLTTALLLSIDLVRFGCAPNSLTVSPTTTSTCARARHRSHIGSSLMAKENWNIEYIYCEPTRLKMILPIFRVRPFSPPQNIRFFFECKKLAINGEKRVQRNCDGWEDVSGSWMSAWSKWQWRAIGRCRGMLIGRSCSIAFDVRYQFLRIHNLSSSQRCSNYSHLFATAAGHHLLPGQKSFAIDDKHNFLSSFCWVQSMLSILMENSLLSV